jgi:hypothetical protein
MAQARCAMCLRPRVSGLIQPGLIYGPAEDVGPLPNDEEAIPCMANLHIISRLDFCRTVTGIPQEASRVKYDQTEIDEYYAELECHL